jgi:hypothetical protein
MFVYENFYEFEFERDSMPEEAPSKAEAYQMLAGNIARLHVSIFRSHVQISFAFVRGGLR